MPEELDPGLSALFKEVGRLEDEAFLATVSRDVQDASRRSTTQQASLLFWAK